MKPLLQSLATFALCYAFAAAAAAAEPNATGADIAAGKHDEIAGHYRASRYSLLEVTREGQQLFAQLAGGQYLELTPDADGYGISEVKGRVTFTRGADGKITEAVLRQGAQELRFPRLNEADAQAVRDALAKRLSEQKPEPGTEDLLRRYIESMRAGKPIFDAMTPQIAAALKPQMELAKTRLQTMGATRAIAFKGVSPNGLDTFRVDYENGATQYFIGLDAEGKIASLGIQPL